MTRLSTMTPPRPRRAPFRRRGRPGWRRAFPALAVLGLLLLAPALVHAQGAGQDSLVLSWTAVGDDSLVGTASQYDLRVYSTSLTAANWDSATALGGLPAPQPSGSAQQYVVHNLTVGTTYYFAIRTVDDAGNWSGISNVVRWDGLADTAPPAAPTGVAAAIAGNGIQVTWNPSPDPGVIGYWVYRATSASGPWTKLNLAVVTSPQYQDGSPPQGASMVWYQVTATSSSGAESARSASASLQLTAALAGIIAWAIQTPYPNPSPLSGPVRIPVDLVTPGVAHLDIVDAAGRLVRRLDLAALPSGHQEPQWDGLNEAGRLVAPGPYRVWLVAGGTRASTRLARVP